VRAPVISRLGSKLSARVKGPLPLGRMQSPTSDGERFDREPGFALGSDPGLGIEALAKVGRVRVHMVQRSADEHRPALLMSRIDAINFERYVH
jgi:hypothetical protein